MPEETQAPLTDSLRPLLELQDVDLASDRLAERKATLPELQELTELETRVREIDAAVGSVQDEIKRVLVEMNRLENEVGTIEDKISREERRMYSGEVVNPKELSAIQAEIEMLKRRKSPLEEAAIEQLMRRDDLQGEKDRLTAEREDIVRAADAIRSRIEVLTADLDGQLESEKVRRGELVPQIPSDVLEQYESIRSQRRGVGVGALSHGVCTACREALSAVELDRIRQKARSGQRLFRCEHCR
ncbi:MAG: hypothetical protein M3133_10020, partial [Actinomycetota bacterium]|nr:hypothetical protein [Actinomycetota bacterium]